MRGCHRPPAACRPEKEARRRTRNGDAHGRRRATRRHRRQPVSPSVSAVGMAASAADAAPRPVVDRGYGGKHRPRRLGAIWSRAPRAARGDLPGCRPRARPAPAVGADCRLPRSARTVKSRKASRSPSAGVGRSGSSCRNAPPFRPSPGSREATMAPPNRADASRRAGGCADLGQVQDQHPRLQLRGAPLRNSRTVSSHTTAWDVAPWRSGDAASVSPRRDRPLRAAASGRAHHHGAISSRRVSAWRITSG